MGDVAVRLAGGVQRLAPILESRVATSGAKGLGIIQPMISRSILLAAALSFGAAHAQTPGASAPYMPSWPVRHQLQLLVDHADLALPMSHWPLPLAAVEQALAQLPAQLPAAEVDLESARSAVLRELQQRQTQGQLRLQVRNRAEGAVGYGDNYTPGSSVQFSSEEKRAQSGDWSVAGRLGLRAEESANSLNNGTLRWGTEGRYQGRLEDSVAAVGWGGWQLQAFSQRFWWSPGWQNSLVNGNNNPAWNGVGLQRSSVRQSESGWLSWMGAWNFEAFLARAQDPLVLPGQTQGYVFGGMKLTMQPWPWLEVGLSRGMQVGGVGRPNGLSTYLKAMLGKETNKWATDPFQDSSGQIAGYELRLRCPKAWGDCAFYSQGMGDDRTVGIPWPIKFTTMLGAEKAFDGGRQRVFYEWVNTNTFSHPLEHKGASYPGYINGVYGQGYTNGTRWAASAFGSGAVVNTVGWMDAERQAMVKLHKGRATSTVGAYDPSVAPTGLGPHSGLWGLSAQRTWTDGRLHWTPEISYLHFEQGQDVGANRKNSLRLGLTLAMPL